MLKSLHIENIAVIESADIEFFGGFNVLTGETGAGKSIIIDSINAVLGERTYREIIRSGCKQAMVSAMFENVSEKTVGLLKEQGLPVGEDKSILLVRTLSQDGRSTLRLNGVPVNMSAIKDVAASLITIHGQHDNQSLLDPEKHIHFIDALAENDALRAEYRALYDKLCAAERRLHKLNTAEAEREQRMDILKYQIRELEAAAIKPGEREKLSELRQRFRNRERISETLGSVNALINGSDEADGAASMAQQAAREIASLSDVNAASSELYDRLASAAAELDEIGRRLRELQSEDDLDTYDQDAVEDRLDLLFRLTKKYGGDEQACLDFLAKAKEELDSIENSDEEKRQLNELIDRLSDEITASAARLTAGRRVAGDVFSDRICQALDDLNMPGARFVVDIKPGKYTANGADVVTFLISANVGEDPRPLAKIASGGELSRIMLAIKSVMSDKDGVSTLIFDEIDAGVSGRTAVRVGEKLRTVSDDHQVICITHLAQIAAAADNHLLIQKENDGERTRTKVIPLYGDDRVREVARIISGGEMTENVYNAAKELIGI